MSLSEIPAAPMLRRNSLSSSLTKGCPPFKEAKTSEVQVQNIEKSLNVIIEQFESMKKDLVFLLSENEDQQK